MTAARPGTHRWNAAAKGRRIQALARKILERDGWLVETAPNVVRWIRRRQRAGEVGADGLKPVSLRHDLWGVWDFACVAARDMGPGRAVAFVQVTTLHGVADRRRKILASGFPVTADDIILGYVSGRSRHFRCFRGPIFAEWTGETWRP